MSNTSTCTVTQAGSEFWKDENGNLHREDDLPAVIYSDGESQWRIDNKIHRTNGPAIIWDDNVGFWFINGARILDAMSFQELAGHSDEKMAELLMKWGPIK